MVSQSPKDLVPHFFDDTAKTYDKVAFWATFGKDKLWKKEIVEKIVNADSILDLACGTGILTRKISNKFPKSQIVGIDISKNYLKIAKRNSSSFSNILFLHQDAENLNIDKKFDCICSSYIPKYCKPEIVVKKSLIHLNPKGRIILHDFTYPKNCVVQKLWNLYFVLLNFVGFFIPSWKYPFIELPKLIRSSNWVNDYTQALKKNGFDVKQFDLTWNSSTILLATL